MRSDAVGGLLLLLLLQLLHDAGSDPFLAQASAALPCGGLQQVRNLFGLEYLVPLQTAASPTTWRLNYGFAFQQAVCRHRRDVRSHCNEVSAAARKFTSVLEHLDLNGWYGGNVRAVRVGVSVVVVDELVARLTTQGYAAGVQRFSGVASSLGDLHVVVGCR
jgi:hypothetical protein